ncbi:DMT family transporter [Anabaena sp. UHCC 0253]|uniref:DMT family transporter n=1 Tax=Anabaena sp. UHCC 0253 TaxID=2590019 RepID=UPI001447EC2A|nr:DMT family transporter [Anabaena sp. UHCC 0253]MTJ55944.1 DMT family transporter [Anabaena sp. UHCC 0253]
MIDRFFPSKIIYGLYVITSGLLSAISVVLTEIIIQNYKTEPLFITVLANTLGGIILLLVVRKKRYRFSASWQVRDAIAIVTTATAYGLAYLLSVDAIRQIGSSKTALLGLLETPFIVALAIIFLRERLFPRQLIAGMFTLTGVFLIVFDPLALQITLGWGEIKAILSSLSFAIGIVVIKPVLHKLNNLWVTALLLLLGSVPLAIITPFVVSAKSLGLIPVLVIIVIGMLHGLIWLTYNHGLKHLGTSHTAILYLSSSFLTVAIQAGVAKLIPVLGLQLPTNLILALSGGVLIAGGIFFLETSSINTD